MNISKRERALLLALLYILIAYGGYKYVCEPVNIKMAAAQSENISLNNQLVDAKNSNLQKQKSLQNADKRMDEYQKMLKKVPGDRDFYEMVAFLTSAADSSGVQLAGISYKEEGMGTPEVDPDLGMNKTEKKTTKETSSNPAKDLTFTVKVTGRYFQLLEYLAELDTCPRIITVEGSEISLSPKKESAPPAVVTQEGDEKTETPVNPDAPKRAADGYDVNNAIMTLQISTFYYTSMIKLPGE